MKDGGSIDIHGIEESDRLLHTFGGFFDAVLTEVHLVLSREGARRCASIRLLAQDQTTDSEGEDRWKLVVFTVEGLSNYRLTEGPETYAVLSDGLQIHWADDGSCTIDLAADGGPVMANGVELPSAQFVSGARWSYEIEDAGA